METKYVFALDVDGVLTDGKFLWDKDGNKVYKEFGPDDADALKLLSKYMNIVLFSKDGKGFKISKSRASHMGFPINYENSQERLETIDKLYGLENTIYMGDSFVDVPILQKVKYGISTATSSPYAKMASDYITSVGGGERAVAEAVFWIMRNILNLEEIEIDGVKIKL